MYIFVRINPTKIKIETKCSEARAQIPTVTRARSHREPSKMQWHNTSTFSRKIEIRAKKFSKLIRKVTFFRAKNFLERCTEASLSNPQIRTVKYSHRSGRPMAKQKLRLSGTNVTISIINILWLCKILSAFSTLLRVKFN